MQQQEAVGEPAGKPAGPSGPRQSFLLFFKGLCMGSADIVPGVSGGTIALITGIYEQLLAAIKSFDGRAALALVRGDWRTVAARVHFRFLFILLAGIGTAVVSMARVVHFLLQHHPVPTWGFFWGLVCASILYIGRKITNWFGPGGGFFLLGALGAYYLVGMIPVTTPETPLFIVFSGAVAICAMILPGISGSFLLLIMGKYQFITCAIRHPLLPENMVVLLLFAAGCVAGILGFSRLLSFMLARYHNLTMALLTGLMCGSLRKVWPWKEVVDSVVIRGRLHVLQERNVLPLSMDGEFYLTLALAAAGFLLVLFLQGLADRETRQPQPA